MFLVGFGFVGGVAVRFGVLAWVCLSFCCAFGGWTDVIWAFIGLVVGCRIVACLGCRFLLGFLGVL